MKLLIDTNIFIPLEPTSVADLEANSRSASRLQRLAVLTNSQVWLHPAQLVDIANDSEQARRTLREHFFSRYPVLDIAVIRPLVSRTNNWVDHQLIEAVRRGAVSALVTEDVRLARRASERVDPERVLTLADAILLLESLQARDESSPPAVEVVQTYNLESEQPFWDSFREDYPGFNSWFRSCQEQHRQAWVIREASQESLIAAAVLKHETEEPRGTKTLKICSFKVDAVHSGRRYGELLLKAVFMYAFNNDYDTLFTTVFSKHASLISLLKTFGFIEEPTRRDTGELVLVKQLRKIWRNETSIDALKYAVKFGPFVVDLNVGTHVVIPIRPEYHEMLFPELQDQMNLIDGREAYGNSIRKAYLCHANIREIPEGSIVYFYRSIDLQRIIGWGVIERCVRSESAEVISDFVLPRSVYTQEEIVAMCDKGPVFAIMFRQCLRKLPQHFGLTQLRTQGVLKSAPQSIMRLSDEAKQWMISQCLMS